MAVVSAGEVFTDWMSTREVCTGSMSNHDMSRRDARGRNVSTAAAAVEPTTAATVEPTTATAVSTTATMSATTAVRGESIGGER